MKGKLRTLCIGLAVVLLLIQWGLPVLMPLNPQLLHAVGPNVNWIIVVTLLGAMVLLGLVVIPALDRKTFVLLLVGVLLDQVIGETVYRLDLPLYLDTIGSVLVGAMLGPTAGALCATMSCSLWIFIAPIGIPFSSATIVTGWIAGLVARLDGFSNWMTALVSGAVAGLTVGIVSSPLTYVLNNTEVDLANFDLYASLASVHSYFQEPFSVWGLMADPIDKMVVFGLVFLVAPWLAARYQESQVRYPSRSSM